MEYETSVVFLPKSRKNLKSNFSIQIYISGFFLKFRFRRKGHFSQIGLRIYFYTCMGTHDTGRSFEPIFMKFTRLMRVHPRVNPIVYGNNRSNRTTDMEEKVHPKQVF